jgi:hypothetical protein
MSLPDELADVIASLGIDERRVLLVLARRLAMGARVYGRLDVDGDPRDWRGEAADEALDASVYLACELLREKPVTKADAPADHVTAEVDRAVG